MEVKHLPYGVGLKFESKPPDFKVSLLATLKHYLLGKEKLSLLEYSCVRMGNSRQIRQHINLLKPSLTKLTFQNRILKVVNDLLT